MNKYLEVINRHNEAKLPLRSLIRSSQIVPTHNRLNVPPENSAEDRLIAVPLRCAPMITSIVPSRGLSLQDLVS